MRAAVVEFNTFHDEILPSVVYALNELGVEPDVYLRGGTVRRDPFVFATGLRFRRSSIDGRGTIRSAAARLRGTPSRFRRYDLVFVNSSEPDDVLATAARIRRPLVALVHNANRLSDDPAHRRFFSSPSRRPMVLARHIAANLAGDGRGPLWLAPYFLGQPPAGEGTTAGPARLCVQGNIEPVRRDYGSLLDAVQLVAADRSDFVVDMVGRSGSEHGRALRADIDARGLTDRFAFNAGELSHRAYRSQVAAADFILPLVHAGVPNLAPYFTVKLTGSMSMAIALGVIPIAEDGLAARYGTEASAVTYAPGGLAGAIRQALDLGPADRASRIARLNQVRSDALAESVDNLATTIARVGVERA